jgi:hypothetical protein
VRVEQAELFASHSGPPGFVYQPDYLSAPEESTLLEQIGRLPFEEARYRDYTARRRIVSFGPEAEKPQFLRPLLGRVAGVSLGAPCRMRFRPFPPRRADPVLSLDLAPRSAYQLCGDVRWRWQHSVPATRALRYSITFRTLAA